MYPLRDKVLTFRQISRHWARDLPQQPSPEEVFDQLLHAYWHGEFEEYAEETTDLLSRKVALSILCIGTHPDITIYFSKDDAERSTRITDDGLIVYPTRHILILPEDEASWTDQILLAAYETLENCRLEEFSRGFRPGMFWHRLTHEQFGEFCDRNGYERPAFWFPQPQTPRRSFAGRTSSMWQIKERMRSRAKAGEMEGSLAAESRWLAEWAHSHLPADRQAPKPRSIANSLRLVYWELKSKFQEVH